MFGDGVVELNIPVGVSQGAGFGSQLIDRGGALPAVEEIVLRSEGAVEAISDIGGALAVVIRDEVVVDDAVDCEIRVERALCWLVFEV